MSRRERAGWCTMRSKKHAIESINVKAFIAPDPAGLRASWGNAVSVSAGLLALLLVPQASAFPPFSVQGTLSYEVPGREVLCGRFTIGLSNSLWHVTVTQELNTRFLSFDYGYDGTNTFQYAVSETSGSAAASGLVEPGPVPSSTGTDAGDIVWLAYASGPYFHSLKTGSATSLEPLRSQHGLTRRYETLADWRLGSIEPFLPTEVSYYATNVPVLGDSGSVTSIPLDGSRRPKYVAAQLRTWDPVAFEGISVPTRFEYTSFGPWPRPGTSGRTAIVRGYATNVGPLIPFPALPKILHLQDRRVPEPMVLYKATNGSLPGLEGCLVTKARGIGQQRFKDNVRAATPAPVPQHDRARWLARILLVFIALAPVAG
jgi:hypothetical protein